MRDVASVAGALVVAGSVGPYFAVSVFDGAAVLDHAAGWRPFTELLHDPDSIDERVRHVRDTLAATVGAPVETRVAASLHQLALASRLVSPALAAACLAGQVPRWHADRLWWRPVPGGPVPLTVAQAGGVAVDDAAEAARQIADLVIGPLVRPLVEAFAPRVSTKTLWGNVASAAAGAARMLHGGEFPKLVEPRQVVAELVNRPPLAGTFDVAAHRRASCCLFYRVPGGGLCGDCVLAG